MLVLILADVGEYSNGPEALAVIWLALKALVEVVATVVQTVVATHPVLTPQCAAALLHSGQPSLRLLLRYAALALMSRCQTQSLSNIVCSCNRVQSSKIVLVCIDRPAKSCGGWTYGCIV